MPLPTAQDIMLVTVNGSLNGQTTLSTFWYKVDEVGAAVNMTQIANALHQGFTAGDGVYDRFKACCPGNWVPTVIWVQTIYPVRYARRNYVVTGTGGQGIALTSNNAAVILRRGDEANRRNVGTLHIPIATDDAAVADGKIIPSSGLWQAMEELRETIPQELTGGVGVVPSRFAPVLVDTKSAIPGGYKRIIDSRSMDTVRVMRRRTVGLGI